MVLELASLEEKKKENDDFRFFKIRFLGFYKAERKSEDIFVLRRVRALSRYLFCCKFSCPFSLTYRTVKIFQPPSSLHRDRYCDL